MRSLRSRAKEFLGRGEPPQGASGSDIGWGLRAEEDEEERIRRRGVFFVVAAVAAGLVGLTFVLMTLTGGVQNQRMLSVTRPARGRPSFYTLKLLEFPATEDKRAGASRLADAPSMQALAGRHEFHIVELASGRLALCVGRFDRQDAPELADVTARFRRYAEDGQRPFAQASVLGPS